VRGCGETDGPEGDEQLLVEIFSALYGRAPDADDELAGVWNLCCAEVES
jgi:hypothetical protein